MWHWLTHDSSRKRRKPTGKVWLSCKIKNKCSWAARRENKTLQEERDLSHMPQALAKGDTVITAQAVEPGGKTSSWRRFLTSSSGTSCYCNARLLPSWTQQPTAEPWKCAAEYLQEKSFKRAPAKEAVELVSTASSRWKPPQRMERSGRDKFPPCVPALAQGTCNIM